MKHTPGPWEAVGTGVYAETPNGSREIIFSRHNTRSAEEPERRANARLIAAAPELYAALREMAFYFEVPLKSPLAARLQDRVLRALTSADGGEYMAALGGDHV